jgi:hypothetical protein
MIVYRIRKLLIIRIVNLLLIFKIRTLIFNFSSLIKIYISKKNELIITQSINLIANFQYFR